MYAPTIEVGVQTSYYFFLGSADSPLCSPSQSGRSSRSEGVAPPPSGPQVGSVHKPAQLIWAACLPYCTVRTVAADLRRGEHIPKMQNNILHENVGALKCRRPWQNVGAHGKMSASIAKCRRLEMSASIGKCRRSRNILSSKANAPT